MGDSKDGNKYTEKIGYEQMQAGVLHGVQILETDCSTSGTAKVILLKT